MFSRDHQPFRFQRVVLGFVVGGWRRTGGRGTGKEKRKLLDRCLKYLAACQRTNPGGSDQICRKLLKKIKAGAFGLWLASTLWILDLGRGLEDWKGGTLKSSYPLQLWRTPGSCELLAQLAALIGLSYWVLLDHSGDLTQHLQKTSTTTHSTSEQPDRPS